MTSQMWLENLAAFSLQVAILVAAGTALVHLFRLKAPSVLLAFWQALLAVCLLLPVFQPWRQERQPIPVAAQQVFETSSLPVLPEPDAGITLPAGPSARPLRFPTYATLALVLAGGAVLRLLWLVLGLLRLQRYLNRSRRLAVLPESVRDMQWSVGVAPEIFFSPDIDTPVTFGWHRPAVLFPDSFIEMSAGMQRTIACHELLHVERRDWLFIVLEELLRSLFWFHPAIWWALGRIHLSREQVVDRQVLKVTGERGPYLESLLHIASLRGRPAAVPAPLLLREHHLVQRVALMLKESKMTRSRLIVSLVAIAAFLLWTGTYATAWFPLTAPPVAVPQVPTPTVASTPTPAPEPVSTPATAPAVNPAPKENPEPKARQQEPLRVGANVQASKLISKVDPVYPELARRARVEQTVILEVLVDAQGNVANIRVIQGHPLLDQAAIEAVRQWRYSPTYLNGQAVQVLATVSVPFILASDSSSRLSNSTMITGVLGGVPSSTTSQGVIIGGAPTGGANPAVKPPQREPIRVGGNVQESKIIKMVAPVYPELAKRARVEQIVMLEVTVNEEGLVSNVRVIRGHPLLDQAAIDAVKQWVYSPTILNGEPMPVVATATLIFSLTPRFTLDADGFIRDPEGAPVSVEKLRENQGSVQITPAPQVSFDLIQQTLAYLQVQGVDKVRLNSQAYVYDAGRLFYLAPATLANPSGAGQILVRAPVLDIDINQLSQQAADALRPKFATGNATTVLSFTICVDEAGQIVAVQSPGGPFDVPELVTALKQARVTTPGLRGNIAVPTAVKITVPVSIK
jgi:TonB family protein